MFQFTHPLFAVSRDGEPLTSTADFGPEGELSLFGGSSSTIAGNSSVPAFGDPTAPLGTGFPDGSIFGLSTSPLFQAGVAGLADNNPLTTIRTGLAAQAQRQAQTQEEDGIRQFGIELAKIAAESGDPTMQRLVALGPEGYQAAVARLNELAEAQVRTGGVSESATGSPRLMERGEPLFPDGATVGPVEPIPAAGGPLAAGGGLGLEGASFLVTSADARPSTSRVQGAVNRRTGATVRADRLGDPIFGAMNPAEARQIAEEVAGLPVPHYRRFKVPMFQFARWGSAVDEAGVTGHARRALMETFAAEGGLDRDDENGAVAGIRPGTLEIVGPRLGIPAGTEPEDLTNEQRTQVYREFINLRRNLGRVGGIEALEQLRDEEVAAVLFDTLFRNGNADGAEAIQRAINSIEPDRVTVDRSFGQETFDAFRDLTNDCSTRQRLLDTLADERRLQFPDEPRRFDHFRFPNSEECG